MKIKPKRPNNSKKYKTNINTVWGMNNSLALISSHRFKIICITIQKSSIAWKSQKIQNWINKSSLPIKVLQKSEFIKKYENVRTQGIVIQFYGEIISSLLTSQGLMRWKLNCEPRQKDHIRSQFF